MADHAKSLLNVLLITYAFPPAGGVGTLRAASLARYLPNEGIRFDVLTTRNPSSVGTAPKQLKGIPPGDPADPNATTYIDYVGCNNGEANFVYPVLPPDLMMPLKIWARQNGTNAVFSEIRGVADGLQAQGVAPFAAVQWDWFQNTLYITGSQLSLDLRVRYIVQIPYISEISEWIPVQNGCEALAYLCAGKFEQSRGNPIASTFLDVANEAIDSIINRTQRRKARISHKRRWRH